MKSLAEGIYLEKSKFDESTDLPMSVVIVDENHVAIHVNPDHPRVIRWPLRNSVGVVRRGLFGFSDPQIFHLESKSQILRYMDSVRETKTYFEYLPPGCFDSEVWRQLVESWWNDFDGSLASAGGLTGYRLVGPGRWFVAVGSINYPKNGGEVRKFYMNASSPKELAAMLSRAQSTEGEEA